MEAKLAVVGPTHHGNPHLLVQTTSSSCSWRLVRCQDCRWVAANKRPRPEQQCSGHRDPLLLTAGQLSRTMPQTTTETRRSSKGAASEPPPCLAMPAISPA